MRHTPEPMTGPSPTQEKPKQSAEPKNAQRKSGSTGSRRWAVALVLFALGLIVGLNVRTIAGIFETKSETAESPTHAGAERKVSIRVRVSAKGTHLRGARVSLQQSAASPACIVATNERGEAECWVSPDDAQAYELWVSAESFGTAVRRVLIPSRSVDQAIEPIDVELFDSTSLSGRVLEQDAHLPFRGSATVTAVHLASQTARSASLDVHGRFAFLNLEPGLYDIRAIAREGNTDPERMDFRSGIELISGEPTYLTFELHRGLEIRGQVRDEESGGTLPGVRVELFGSAITAPLRTETDEEGTFLFSYLEDDCRIVVQAQDYLPASYSCSHLTDIRMRRGREMRGVVQDQDGRPIAGARLSYFFETELLGAANTQAANEASEHTSLQDQALLELNPNSAPRGLALEVTSSVPPIPLNPEPESTSSQASPIAAPNLGRSAQAEADDQGRFSFRSLPSNARGFLSVEAAGFAPKTLSDVSLDDPRARLIVLQRAGLLSVRVLDSRGNAAPAVRIELTKADEPASQATIGLTGSDGIAVFRGLLGNVHLVASFGEQTGEADANISQSQNAEVEIRLATSANKRFRVLDERSQPVANARIEIIDVARASLAQTSSDADGRFALPGSTSRAEEVVLRIRHASCLGMQFLVHPQREEASDFVLPNGFSVQVVLDSQDQAEPASTLSSASIVAFSDDARHLPSTASFVSESDGQYRFAHIAAGQHWLRVRVPGFAEEFVDLRVRRSSPRNLMTIRLRKQFGIEIPLVDASGSLTSNHRACLNSFQCATSDSQGILRFQTENGDHVLDIESATQHTTIALTVRHDRLVSPNAARLPWRVRENPSAPPREADFAFTLDGENWLISRVRPNSQAERLGLRPADLCVPIPIAASGRHTMRCTRQETTLFVPLPAQSFPRS